MVVDGEYTITEKEARLQKAMALLEAREAREAHSRLIAKAEEIGSILDGISKAVKGLTMYGEGNICEEMLLIALSDSDEARNSETLVALSKSLSSSRERLRASGSTLKLLGLSS